MERPTPQDALTDEELELLLAQIGTRYPTGKRNLAALLLMSDAGLRVGEVCALTTKDLVRAKGSVTHVQIRNGKGGKPGVSPRLTIRAAAAMKQWLQARKALGIRSGPVFCTVSKGHRVTRFSQDGELVPGEPLSTAYMRAVVKRLRAKAGIEKNVSPHTLRHTFATRYLRAGGDLERTRKALRHASITTTAAIYSHLVQQDVDEGIEALNEANGDAEAEDPIAALTAELRALRAEVAELRRAQ